MKLDIEKAWCIRMAELEGDAEIGAGLLAVDPIPEDTDIPDGEPVLTPGGDT